ncbi:hypothetical protein JCM16303_004918 [Sporobolomyces ruberrimus]
MSDLWNKLEQPYQVAITAAIGLALLIVFFVQSQPKAKPALDAKEWQKFKLTDKIVVSPNTAIYRFALKRGERLGLPIGQHVSVSAEIGGKLVQRSYTPTSSDDDLGHFDLLVKSYPTGNISKHFGELRVGDFLSVKGPKGQMKYSPDYATKIGMIAGGTGITPMLQIIRAAMKNPLDRTKISLIYANVNPSDILLKAELDSLATAHPDRFSVYYVLNNPPKDEKWTGGEGFVTKDMIEQNLPESIKEDDSLAKGDHRMLMCGPPPMINAMKGHLKELGWPEPRTISKMEDKVFCF